SGAVILVSHDRYLLEACADRLWLVANGAVVPYEGDLDDYRRFVLAGDPREKATTKPNEKSSRADQRRAAAEKRAELAPLKRRIAAVEADIAAATRRIAEIDRALADTTLYARDAARATALAKERADAAAALA